METKTTLFQANFCDTQIHQPVQILCRVSFFRVAVSELQPITGDYRQPGLIGRQPIAEHMYANTPFKLTV